MIDSNNICLSHTGTMVTTACNLNCKLCCTFVHRLRDLGISFSYDRLIETYDKYFALIKYVDKFSLGGGEPLLFLKLPELIEHIMNQRDKFGVLEVITNGTLIPSDELLNVLEKYRDKTEVLVDNYGEISCVAEKVGALLTERKIKNRVRKYHGEDCHCGGWVDLGDYSCKHPTEEEQIEIFHKCAYFTRSTVIGVCAVDGLLYSCGRCYLMLREGIITEEKGFVNLFDETKSIEELRNELINLLEIPHPPACAFCNGMCKDSPRFMPAEQF